MLVKNQTIIEIKSYSKPLGVIKSLISYFFIHIHKYKVIIFAMIDCKCWGIVSYLLICNTTILLISLNQSSNLQHNYQ